MAHIFGYTAKVKKTKTGDVWTVYKRFADGRELVVCECTSEFSAKSCEKELLNLLGSLHGLEESVACL